MDLMRSYRIPFGVSICYTSRNYKVVTSDEFLDLLISKGCVFAWYFHYMPVEQNADTLLLLTPGQRTYMKDRVREIRGVTGGKEFTASTSRTTASLRAAASQAAESGAHSTDLETPESAEHRCDKCRAYAACRQPTAESLWQKDHSERV